MANKSKQELEQEYVGLCQRLGEAEFRVTAVKTELSRLNEEKNNITQKLQNLSKSYTELVNANPETKSPEEMTKDLGLATEEQDVSKAS